MNSYNNSDSDNKVYDARTETFIPISNGNSNSNGKTIDKNERVIWTFTLGIQIDITSVYEYEKQTENFENAVQEMTKEITKITDGLTYNYCHGMWLRKNQGSLELTPLEQENSSSNSNNNNNNIEHNLSVQITIIVLPEIADIIYNVVKYIISNVNKKYELGLKDIHAMKTSGTKFLEKT